MTRPKCTVNGVKSKGSMCSQIIVNGKLCGYDGDCEHKEFSNNGQRVWRDLTDDEIHTVIRESFDRSGSTNFRIVKNAIAKFKEKQL